MPEPDPQWYRSAFGQLYPLLYAHRSDDAAETEIGNLIQTLNWKPPLTILDACCGTGRHADALTRLGFNVFGFDLSWDLLSIARKRGSSGTRLTRSDIRRLPFRHHFDGVLNLFSSFGYFKDDVENREALFQMAGCLKPDGVLVMDHIYRPFLEARMVPRSEDIINQNKVIQIRRIEQNRVIKDIFIASPQGQRWQFQENVRLFTAAEIAGWFEQAGLRVLAQWGDFAGSALSEETSRMITVGRKVPDHESGV